MDDSLGDLTHPLDNRLPVLGQLLHPCVAQVDGVSVELAVRLACLSREVVIGADNDVVIVNEVCSETVSEGLPQRLVILESVSRIVCLGVPGDGDRHHDIGLPEGSARGDDVTREHRGHTPGQTYTMCH